MDENKNKFIQKKHIRTQTPQKYGKNPKQKFLIVKENLEYIISIELIKEKKIIIIKCISQKNHIKYKANFELIQLKCASKKKFTT